LGKARAVKAGAVEVMAIIVPPWTAQDYVDAVAAGVRTANADFWTAIKGGNADAANVKENLALSAAACVYYNPADGSIIGKFGNSCAGGDTRVTVAWTSNSAAVTAAGAVTRGASDAAVTLTASLSLAGATADPEPTIAVTVKAIVPVYTVLFNANGGTVTPASGTTVEGMLASLPTPKRAPATGYGWKFAGWEDEDGEEVDLSYTYNGNATIYAQWEQVKVSVPSGVTVTWRYTDEGKVVKSVPTSKPSNNVKFGGWCLESATPCPAGQSVTFPYDFSRGSDLYPMWKYTAYKDNTTKLRKNVQSRTAPEDVEVLREGEEIVSGELAVYNSMGNIVARIPVSDGAFSGEEVLRKVGSWDLKGKDGKVVPSGTYLVRGKIRTVWGDVEKVSVKVGVR
jgi:hypothetical protein